MEKYATAKQSHSLSKNQKWTIASTSTGFGLESMDILFVSFTLSSMIKDLHISSAAGGMISSITYLGMLLGGILFGLLADRYGRVKTFSYTIFIFAIATGAMYFANSITSIYFFRFLAGIGAGGEYGTGMTLIAENFRANQIGKISSISSIGGQGGAIIAAILASFIIPMFGWHALFLVGLIPVALAYFVRSHMHESKAFVDETKHVGKPKVSITELFKTPALAWQTIALIIMITVQTGGYYGLMNWLPSIMQKQLNLSVSGSSTWMISTIIGMSLGMMTFGTILDYFGPRKAFGIFLIAAAISLFSLMYAFNAWSLLLFAAVVGFFSNGMYGGYGAIMSQLYPTEIRATANNTIMNTGRVIGGFSPVLIGFMMDHYSFGVIMAGLSVAYIISFFTMMSIPALRRLSHNTAK
ncbi:MFS transporter [Philodulcilactobacillus myokoensis]|uniref:MFS transporter n=1 Tax=Philodulcilactobacillus myokoensis TaxID=2929573 RepID=A0A9W6ESE7_9LACO|nr:MFS transporter [Philodulcilactobacillus myokoensis]GLB46074.1 MFS transporter [Philodulcilactobacillus myokoensis]